MKPVSVSFFTSRKASGQVPVPIWHQSLWGKDLPYRKTIRKTDLVLSLGGAVLCLLILFITGACLLSEMAQASTSVTHPVTRHPLKGNHSNTPPAPEGYRYFSDNETIPYRFLIPDGSAITDEARRLVEENCLSIGPDCASSSFEAARDGIMHYDYEISGLYLSGLPDTVNAKIARINRIIDRLGSHVSMSRFLEAIDGFSPFSMGIETPVQPLKEATFNRHIHMIPKTGYEGQYYHLETATVEDNFGGTSGSDLHHPVHVSSVRRNHNMFGDIPSEWTGNVTAAQHVDVFRPAIKPYEEATHFFAEETGNTGYRPFTVLKGVIFSMTGCIACKTVDYHIDEYGFGTTTRPDSNGISSLVYSSYQDRGTQKIDDDVINVIQAPYHTTQRGIYVIFMIRHKRKDTDQAY